MLYMGVDYHKKRSHITMMGDGGEIVWRGYTANTKESIAKVLEMGRKDSNGTFQAVVEATNCWNVIYEILEEAGVDVKLAHTLKVRAIAEAQIKTDKIDSAILAHLLRCQLVPECYVPASHTRLIKQMIRQRLYLVNIKTGIKNKVHQVLTRNHVDVPLLTDLFGKAGRKFLKDVMLKETEKRLLDNLLTFLQCAEQCVKDIEKALEEETQDDEQVKLLLTIPGIGKVFAVMLAYEIDDISRFSHPKKLCAYAGVVPSTYSSDQKTYHGRSLWQCNKYLKWALIEGAWKSIVSSYSFQDMYHRYAQKMPASKAIMRVAKRLCEVVYYVLTERRPYYERPNSRVAPRSG